MMYNPAGFDDTDLISDPQARQRALPGGYANQGEMVSAPYRQANMAAAEKTNEMNAISQEPGKAFLDQYMQKSGAEQGQTAFDPFKFFGGKAMEQGDKARRGELEEEPDAGLGAANSILRARQKQMEQLRQMGF